MSNLNCPVVNCNLECRTVRGLAVHIAKKHPGFQQTTKQITVILADEERQAWNRVATQHNMNLSDYIRFLVREGIEGKEDIRKAELETKYKTITERLEKDKSNLEQEIQALKRFFIQKMNNKKSKLDKRTLWLLKNCKGFDKDIESWEEQNISNKLIEKEWNSLSNRQQLLVKRLLNKMPFINAVKKVKGECSKDFEMFFKKELISV